MHDPFAQGLAKSTYRLLESYSECSLFHCPSRGPLIFKLNSIGGGCPGYFFDNEEQPWIVGIYEKDGIYSYGRWDKTLKKNFRAISMAELQEEFEEFVWRAIRQNRGFNQVVYAIRCWELYESVHSPKPNTQQKDCGIEDG